MSGDKKYGQTGAAEPLVLLPGKAGHELLTGARSNEVKMSHLAPCSSEQTTMLVWTIVLRPHSRLECQQVTCHLYHCREHRFGCLGTHRWFLDSLHTAVFPLSTPCSMAMSGTYLMDCRVVVHHIKKKYKKKRKKCVAHISTQLVSAHQQNLSWLFDHMFIANVAGAWDKVFSFFLVSVGHREGNLSKHYGTVFTCRAWKAKVPKMQRSRGLFKM